MRKEDPPTNPQDSEFLTGHQEFISDPTVAPIKSESEESPAGDSEKEFGALSPGTIANTDIESK